METRTGNEQWKESAVALKFKFTLLAYYFLN